MIKAKFNPKLSVHIVSLPCLQDELSLGSMLDLLLLSSRKLDHLLKYIWSLSYNKYSIYFRAGQLIWTMFTFRMLRPYQNGCLSECKHNPKSDRWGCSLFCRIWAGGRGTREIKLSTRHAGITMEVQSLLYTCIPKSGNLAIFVNLLKATKSCRHCLTWPRCLVL